MSSKEKKPKPENKPWCTCGVHYYSYSLNPQPYQPSRFIQVNKNCLKCGKIKEPFYKKLGKFSFP